MEPATRLAFEYPIYGMEFLDDRFLVVAGGGGQMKSGIPNACEVVSFEETTKSLVRKASVSLSDAPVALATNGTTTTLVVGPGCKNYVFKPPKELSPVSSFAHDLRVHKTQEQSAIGIAKNGTRMAVASDEGHLIVIQLPHWEALFSKQVHMQGVIDLSITDDAHLVATVGRDRTAYILYTQNGEVLQDVQPVMPKEMRTHIRAIRFVPTDSSLIFTAESNPRKGGWIAARRSSNSAVGGWTPISCIRASSDALTAFTINNNATAVAVSSSEGHVTLLRWNGAAFSRIWSTESGSSLFKTPTPPHVLPVTAMRFSSSGAHLLTASADYTIAVWPTVRPINYRRLSSIFVWILSILVMLFAILVAEEQHLPASIQRSRSQLQPYLDPHLSKLQDAVQPQIREGAERLQPYWNKLQDAAKPHMDTLNVKVKPLLPLYHKARDEVAPVVRQGLKMVRKASSQAAKLREESVLRVNKVLSVLSKNKNKNKTMIADEPLVKNDEISSEMADMKSDERQEEQPEIVRNESKEDVTELEESQEVQYNVDSNQKGVDSDKTDVVEVRNDTLDSNHSQAEEQQLEEETHEDFMDVFEPKTDDSEDGQSEPETEYIVDERPYTETIDSDEEQPDIAKRSDGPNGDGDDIEEGLEIGSEVTDDDRFYTEERMSEEEKSMQNKVDEGTGIDEIQGKRVESESHETQREQKQCLRAERAREILMRKKEGTGIEEIQDKQVEMGTSLDQDEQNHCLRGERGREILILEDSITEEEPLEIQRDEGDDGYHISDKKRMELAIEEAESLRNESNDDGAEKVVESSKDDFVSTSDVSINEEINLRSEQHIADPPDTRDEMAHDSREEGCSVSNCSCENCTCDDCTFTNASEEVWRKFFSEQ